LALVTVTGRGVPFPRSVAFVSTCTATPSGVDGIPWVSDVDAGPHDVQNLHSETSVDAREASQGGN